MTFTHGHALLIGVGTHRHHPHLDVPITMADARAVADVLRDTNACGYPPAQVQIRHEGDATKAGILAALDELAGRVRPEHTVVLFFCGHGALGTDGNYHLVCHDTQLEGSRVRAGTGIGEPELLDKLRQLPAERLLLLFNTCHAGSVSPTLASSAPSLTTSNPPADAVTALLGTGTGRIIITACREEQVSYIGSGSLTIFTQSLVDGLRGRGVSNNNGFISTFSLYEHLYETVRETVQDQFQRVQEPELTVLKGVGPFAVSLYRGASTLGDFQPTEPLPTHLAVREVKPEKSARAFRQQVIQTGGGAHIPGSVTTSSGDFIGRDKIVHGDEVRGNKVGGVTIGNVSGGIHDAVIAGRDARNIHVGSGTTGEPGDPVTESPTLQSLRALLSTLYDTEADARRVAQDAGIDTRRVDFNDKPVNVWHNVLVEAHHQDKVKAVVATASFEYPTKAAEMRQAYAAYTCTR